VEMWEERDPILRLEKQILEENPKVAKEIDLIHKEINTLLDEAVAFAKSSDVLPVEEAALISPPSAKSRQEKTWNLPATPTHEGIIAWPHEKTLTQATEMTYAKAIYHALARALENPETILLGEDIANYRGSFKVTDDLFERFGRARVRDTPISENGIVGAGVGLAMEGFRPVVEIMFMDFILLALDQLANHAAKFPWMHGGRPLPLVVRTPAGGRRGYGPTHSQCFESILMSIPGLRVFTPSTPQDAYDLTLSAIFGDMPTVIVENKLLYSVKGIVNPQAEPLPIGKARIVRQGRDVTLITFGDMVRKALSAAETLATQHDIEAEVIDLRTLSPLDWDTLMESAQRTQHAMTIEEGTLTGGVGAELAARLQEECFGYLDAPVMRIAAKDCPQPTQEALERAVLPWERDIVEAAIAMRE